MENTVYVHDFPENVVHDIVGQGSVVLHESVDSIRERTGGSVDQLFRDMFRAQI